MKPVEKLKTPDKIDVSPDYRCVSLNRVLYALAGLCPECQQKARSALLGSRDHPIQQSIAQIIERSSLDTGIPTEDILTRGTKKYVEMRRRIVVAARDQSYSLKEIGRALGLHHTSVLYLLRSARKNGSDHDRQTI